MKSFKKLLSFVLSIVMLSMLAVPAFALDTSGKDYIIKSPYETVNSHTWAAYNSNINTPSKYIDCEMLLS